ncbi:MAG: ATP-binding protein [Saprospiraceae bacterium]
MRLGIWGIDLSVDFPFLSLTVFLIFQYGLFIKFKNITFSGILLLVSIYLALVAKTMTTGGLYSDNLLFVLAILPVAALILDIRQTIFLAVLNIAFICYLYQIEAVSPGLYFNQANFEPFYYFNALLRLFTSISITIIISGIILYKTFKKLQTQKVESIRNQIQLIENQQQLIDKQQELMQVNERLQKMEGSLKKSNLELERFAYATSHDLKQPVRVMSSFASLMANRMRQLEIEDEPMAEYLNFIQTSGTSMTRLIEQLMEYARAKNHDKASEKSVDVNRLVETIILQLDLKNRNTNTKVRTIVDLDVVEITGHSSRLRQLFQNLISNAVKFSTKSKEGIIHIGSIEKEEEYCFYVADNGIGISPEHQENVFQLFTKLHKKDDYEGSGIGLSTCREIVEQHGGKIWVDPDTIEGCKICFSIPVSRIKKTQCSLEAMKN